MRWKYHAISAFRSCSSEMFQIIRNKLLLSINQMFYNRPRLRIPGECLVFVCVCVCVQEIPCLHWEACGILTTSIHAVCSEKVN